MWRYRRFRPFPSSPAFRVTRLLDQLGDVFADQKFAELSALTTRPGPQVLRGLARTQDRFPGMCDSNARLSLRESSSWERATEVSFGSLLQHLKEARRIKQNSLYHPQEEITADEADGTRDEEVEQRDEEEVAEEENLVGDAWEFQLGGPVEEAIC